MGNRIATLGVQYIPMFVVLIILFGIYYSHRYLPELAYDRQAIVHGEWWRLLTGHLVHNNFRHLLMNAGAWVIVCYWLVQMRALYLYTIIVVMCLGVSLLTFYFTPTLGYYVGFSAVLHGLFFVAGVQDIRRGLYVGYVLCGGLLTKVAWQLLDPASTADTATMIGLPVAVDVHALGLFVGAVIAIFAPARD